jgi:hypothetical protein
VSSTQPHWRLALSFDYDFPSAAAGVGVDMMVSRRNYNAGDSLDLRLNVFGFFTDFRYKLKDKDPWTVSLGLALGARSVTYENASNNSFNPTDWIPSVPDSPVGSTMHFVAIPFLQVDLSIASFASLLARIGYDVHVGPDYQDVTAASLSGPSFTVGLRVGAFDSP